MKKLYKLFVFVFLSLVVASSVRAESLNTGKLTISYPGSGPLFSESNIAPGFSVSKIIEVTNSDSVPHAFSMAVQGNLDGLADVLIVEIRDIGDNKVYFNKNLSQISRYPQSDIAISSIQPGETRKVGVSASLPENISDVYKNSTTSFDFVFGTEAEKQTATLTIDDATASRIGQSLANNLPIATIEENAQSGSVEKNQEVKGVSTSDGIAHCFWWWLLSVIYFLFLSIYGFIAKKRALRFNWFWPLMIGAMLLPIHQILHSHYSPVRWCDYFVYYDIGLFLIYLLFVNGRRSQKPTKK